MTGLLLGLLGATFGFGLLLLATAWTDPPETPVGGRLLERVDTDLLVWQLAFSTIGGLVLFVATGWLVGGLGGAVGGWLAAGAWRRRGVRPKDEQQRIEALAVWCEQLRDLLSAEQGVMGTVQATVPTAPGVLRPYVSRLATGLARRRPEQAVQEFAAEIDDPSADLVARVLSVAMTRSGRTSELLSELATTIRARAEMRIRVETERSGQRTEARLVIGLACVVMVGVPIFGRGTDFLEPYESGEGQLILLMVGGLFLAGIVWLSRLTRFERAPRFLTVEGGRR